MAQTTSNQNTTPKVLSILVSLDGLSFCVLSFGKITILKTIKFEKNLNPSQTLERLQKLLSSEQLLSQDFDKTSLTVENELFTTVPQALFDESQLTNYLKFSTKLLKTDFAAFDEVDIVNANTVYIPFTNINNFIYDQFGDFTYKHANTVFIEAIMQQQEQSGVFVNVNNGSFNCVVLNEGKFELCNRFPFSTEQDFVYYILFAYEQLKLDREIVTLFLSGSITESSENYSMAYTYIRHIKFFNYKGYDTDTDLEVDSHQHLLLMQALL